jgi:type II secretory pathway pseudopilin PulG
MAKKSGNTGTTILIITVVAIPAMVAFIGIAAAIAIPVLAGYLARAKTSEASSNVRSIHALLAGSVADQGWTEAPRIPRTPLAVGCGAKTMVDWANEDPGWSTIGFSVAEPTYYSYEVEPLAGGAYVIRAIGDLDCDGTYATFELRGHIDPTTREAISDGDIVITDELE